MNSASASNRIIKLIVYRVDTRYSKAASWSMYPTPKDSIKVSAYLMRHFREKSIFLQLFYFCTIFHRLLFTPWKVSVFGVVFVSLFFFSVRMWGKGEQKTPNTVTFHAVFAFHNCYQKMKCECKYIITYFGWRVDEISTPKRGLVKRY